MSELAVTKKVKISENRAVEVRELTVGEVRQWLADLESEAAEEADIVGEFLRGDLSLRDLARLTDLTVEDMDDLPQSALAKIAETAKGLNPDFFGMRDRLNKAGQRMASAGASGS